MPSFRRSSLRNVASAVGAVVTAVPAFFAYLTWSAEPQTEARSMTERFNNHVTDWSKIHLISDSVFEELTEETSLETWKGHLVLAFERDGRREFIAMSIYFNNALVCAQEACDPRTIYRALEAPICVFWNKTWPYYEHLTKKRVILSDSIQRFTESRDCRAIELESADDEA